MQQSTCDTLPPNASFLIFVRISGVLCLMANGKRNTMEAFCVRCHMHLARC